MKLTNYFYQIKHLCHGHANQTAERLNYQALKRLGSTYLYARIATSRLSVMTRLSVESHWSRSKAIYVEHTGSPKVEIYISIAPLAIRNR